MNKERKKIIANNEVSNLYTLNLGGYKQKVLVEGKSKTLPVVICLHGGPGTPIPFSVGCRGLFPEFTDQFIMVYWDQLGCGANNYKIDDSFTVDMFVAMTKDLIIEIKRLFPENDLYMFATSWGSVLSVKVLQEMPNAIKGVVVYGQIVKNLFYNQEVFDALSQTKISAKKLEIIKNTNIDNITTKDLMLVSGSIRKYTNGYENRKANNKEQVGKIIVGMLTSPDYRTKDFIAVMVNGYLKNVSLWRELLHMDLSSALSSITVPYAIIQGDTDIVTPTNTVLEATKTNPAITCQVIPNSGHYPSKPAMDAVVAALQNMVGK